jgi:hypothetical protein
MAQLEITFTRFLQNEPNFPSCVHLAPAAPATMCDQIQADTADTLWLTKAIRKPRGRPKGSRTPRKVLIAHAIEFMEENGGGPGVRLRKPTKQKR